MAKKAKSRTIAVRLISMAMTGYYRTMVRPRTHRPLSMLKYDPVVKKKVLFLEATKGGEGEMIYDISYPSICNVQLGSFKSKV
ncbi:54S ribosomal protein L39, mitochondrial [Aspergillus fumigatus]